MNAKVNDREVIRTSWRPVVVPSAQLIVAENGDVCVVVTDDDGVEWDESTRIEDALDALIATLDADDFDEAIRDFVRDWGWLDICQHSYPDRHDGLTVCGPRLVDGRPAVSTRLLRDVVEALLNVEDLAARTRKRQRWSKSAQNSLKAWPTPRGFRGGLRIHNVELRQSREYLATYLTNLMRLSGVAPVVEWTDQRRPIVSYEADGLLSMLSLELMRRISSPDDVRRDIDRCSVCGREVNLYRSKRDGDDVYCKDDACQRTRKTRNKRASREAAANKGDKS